MGSLKGKVGYVNNRDLHIPKSGGHYVVIRERRGNKVDVNVITSLGTTSVSNKSVTIPSNKNKRLYYVARGKYVAIPQKDTNLTQWSAIHRRRKTVDLSKVHNIGSKWINRKHLFHLGK